MTRPAADQPHPLEVAALRAWRTDRPLLNATTAEARPAPPSRETG